MLAESHRLTPQRPLAKRSAPLSRRGRSAAPEARSPRGVSAEMAALLGGGDGDRDTVDPSRSPTGAAGSPGVTDGETASTLLRLRSARRARRGAEVSEAAGGGGVAFSKEELLF